MFSRDNWKIHLKTIVNDCVNSDTFKNDSKIIAKEAKNWSRKRGFTRR